MARYVTGKDLRQDLKDFRSHVDRRLDKIEHRIRGDISVATAAEQSAINDLSDSVEELASDLGGVSGAMSALQNKITSLQADAVVSANTIADLQASASDVVGKLSPITSRIRGIDSGLKSPPTPDSPLSAT